MTRIEPRGERLAANVAHFTRLVRRAGLRVGPGDMLDAEVAAGTGRGMRASLGIN